MLGSNFRLLCQLPNPISRCPLSFLEPQVWAVLLSTEGNHPERGQYLVHLLAGFYPAFP